MVGFGAVHHGKRHNIGDAKNHEGDIYDALVGALHALTAANVAVDTQTLHDAISAAIVGMVWQQTIIRFEAMVTNEPVAPSDGDRYISTEAGTIPSTTQAVLVDDVCEWDSATSLWIITTPDDGWAVQETQPDPNIAWWYSGSAWRKIGTMVDHSNLLNLNWSVASHVMDTVLDMNSNQINELADGILATDAINKGQISYPVSANFTYCSQTRGNNVTGDGSENNPYATIQKAIDLIGENEHRIIIIDDDEGSSLQNVTLPDASIYKSAVIICHSAITTWYGGIGILTMGDNWSLLLNSIQVKNGMVESIGCAWAEVWCENVHIHATPNMPNTDFFCSGGFMAESTWDGMTVASRRGFTTDSGIANPKTMFHGGIAANGKVEHVTDGVAADDGAAFGQIGGAITTHAGLPNAHHTHPIANEKAGIVPPGAFVGIGQKSYAVVFNTAMPSNNYAVAITGEDNRNWQVQLKTANGFTIQTNSAVVPGGNTFWIARLINDP